MIVLCDIKKMALVTPITSTIKDSLEIEQTL